MRILVFSDIHDNIANVRLLRSLEANVYDVVVIAGDIGDVIAEELYSLVDTFGC